MHPLVLITPCSRPQNLEKVKSSIRFEHIRFWIIVYDGSKVEPWTVPNFHHDQILEMIHTSEGAWGNPQRNFALQYLSQTDYEGLVGFLDDDNTIIPPFWAILEKAQMGKVNAFDRILRGWRQVTLPIAGFCDTATVLVDFSLKGADVWRLFENNADGMYIENIVKQTPGCWNHIPEIGAVYNSLRRD